ncbi:MAG: 1-deoxy-D-xylulose-5-phosphate synthase [Coriobacteriales bacterium]|jgi:1-deoxy-D-xylulose-5-phosphate synthase|nr:1-deoxy-D-xylulose-5-phosphate synthase [Coriobacteriales bacterium]
MSKVKRPSPHSLRKTIIETVSRSGGHLASSLGAVDIICALDEVFDFSHDRILFDVGHQAYAYKLLTGRAARFSSLRQFGGLAPFLDPDESPADVYHSGHASDSLSIASGLASARDLAGQDFKIVTVIGDAAITGGMAFEALNQIGQRAQRMLIILNDNGMSISETAGAVAQYLSRIRLSPSYTKAKQGWTERLSSDNPVERSMAKAGMRAKNKLKELALPENLFEDLGLTYYGPVDGHNLKALINTFNRIKDYPGPVLCHVRTRKGKGYPPAEANPSLFHGVGSFDVESGQITPDSDSRPTYTQVFSGEALKLAATNPDLVALTAAMQDGTGLDPLQKSFPERCFDLGIAEEHSVAFAAGLAIGGKIPLVCIYSAFLQRALDQIITDVCLPKLHVVFCIDRAGLVGHDGPTHHGAFDLAYLQGIPNLQIIAPATQIDLEEALAYAVDRAEGPVAIRYARGAVCQAFEDLTRQGDIEVWPLGACFDLGAEVAQGLGARLRDPLWVKPLEARPDASTKTIVTIEDGVLQNGFGEAVALAYPDIRVLRFGLPDRFVSFGSITELREQIGLSSIHILQQVKAILQV